MLILILFFLSGSEGRAMYAGYFPASGTISVVLVNTVQNREITPNILERQFRDACQAFSVDASVFGDGIVFKVSQMFYTETTLFGYCPL